MRLRTRCLAVGRSGEVPLLEVLNIMVSIWKTIRSMRDGRCRESGRFSEARGPTVLTHNQCAIFSFASYVSY